MDSLNKQIGSNNKPILNIQTQQNHQASNPTLEITDPEDVTKHEGELKITKIPDSGRSEAMGKTNILEWVRNNMAEDLANGNIVDVKAIKMTDENKSAEWKLVDIKDPNDPQGRTKTCLQIQTFWVIKTKDGKERIATQYLVSGVEWPKDNSAQQLEAVRRATLAINLYTHTMARPLTHKESDLPRGFRFQDLVVVHRLIVGIESKGPLKERVKVEISTPSGQGLGSRGLSYTLVQKVDGVGRAILGSEMSLKQIDKEARHAVVKEAGGRAVNPEEREAYAMEQRALDDDLKAELEDPVKCDHLLQFMDKDNSRHLVDYAQARRLLLTGPKTTMGVHWASVKNTLSYMFPIRVTSTQQQLLQKFVDQKEEIVKIDDKVNKLREKVDDLAVKMEGAVDLERTSYENQHKSANEELLMMLDHQTGQHKIFDGQEKIVDRLLFRMEGAYTFLASKETKNREMAEFVTQKAYLAAGHKIDEHEPPTINQMLKVKGVKEKFSPIEDHFVKMYQKMGTNLSNMKSSIDKVRDKLGLSLQEGFDIQLEETLDSSKDLNGVLLEEINSMDDDQKPLLDNAKENFEEDV